jgi:excisionase family DNA binding protein
MTIKEYAVKYSITRQTVYNKIKKGDIKPVRLGSQQLIPIS